MAVISDEPAPRWYALNVAGNKVFAARDELQAAGIECYVPVSREYRPSKTEGARPVVVERPAVARLMFVRCLEDDIIAHERSCRTPFHIYRTLGSQPSERHPIAIPEQQMQIFILVSSSGEQGLEYFPCSVASFHPGSRVRVTQGIFRGAVGHIKRIKGDRRFIVEVHGVCAIATPYIPAQFLEPLPD